MKTDFPAYAEAYFLLRYRSGEIAFHTWKNACSHVRGFADFLRETGRSGSLPLVEVGPGILQEYRSHLLEAGNRASTVDRKLHPLRLALRRAEEEGLVRPGTAAWAVPAGKGKGFLSERTGGWTVPFVAQICAALVGAVFFALLWNARPNGYGD